MQRKKVMTSTHPLGHLLHPRHHLCHEPLPRCRPYATILHSLLLSGFNVFVLATSRYSFSQAEAILSLTTLPTTQEVRGIDRRRNLMYKKWSDQKATWSEFELDLSSDSRLDLFLRACQ
ncbi:MAG TPA: hypothetical protein DEP84_09370 [Chloroflexi bacterium]|nr:hypothetical protein [Chloroflexota bacterium]